MRSGLSRCVAKAGRSAWWLPPGLQRILPDIDIGGTRLATPAGHAITPTHSEPRPGDLAEDEAERVAEARQDGRS